jgi:hypothetical protein
MPAISEDDSSYITKALLAMRGVNQKVHKKMHEEGTLKLFPKPFAYKGTSHSWLRNLKRPEDADDWTTEPALPDGPLQKRKPLKVIICPEPQCGHMQSTKSRKLQVKVGFCQLTCQGCRSITSTKHWKCLRGHQWHKCAVHVQTKLLLSVPGFPVVHSAPRRKGKRFCTDRGLEQPKPKSKKFAEHNDPNCIAIINTVAPTSQTHFLEPGTKLATKFPHLVKLQNTQGCPEGH